MARRGRQSNPAIWIILASIAAGGVILLGVTVFAFLDRETGPRYEITLGPKLTKAGVSLGPWRRQGGGWGTIVALPSKAAQEIHLGLLSVDAATAEGVKLNGAITTGPSVKPGESGLLVVVVPDSRVAKVTLDLP